MIVLAIAASLALAACAQSPEPISIAGPAGGQAAASGYQLTPEELALDCKKLTGRMQVRILQARGYSGKLHPTEVSRTVKTASSEIFGGASSISPEQQVLKDRAMLEAYNSQLAAKKCRTFDLAAELNAPVSGPTPKPR